MSEKRYTINLNDKVRFVPTPQGEQLIRDHDAHWNAYHRAPPGYQMDWFKYHEPLDEQGTREEQLWVLMAIFGSQMHMGMIGMFFKDNQLTFSSEQTQ